MDFYGALGCLLFASDFKYNVDYELPDANFNSFLDSIMTLFQLFVGEAWNDVMEAAMNTGPDPADRSRHAAESCRSIEPAHHPSATLRKKEKNMDGTNQRSECQHKCLFLSTW